MRLVQQTDLPNTPGAESAAGANTALPDRRRRTGTRRPAAAIAAMLEQLDEVGDGT